ncbi:PCNA-like protein [environmental Halophage eHP-16]|jgi:proliferating cell nuclear antigen|nr:PCNA-like protein [environmental Halophage eHP-16]
MSGGFGFRIPVATLSDAIAALRTIVDESKLRFDETGLQSRAVDPANVAMADVTVPDAAFKRLNVGDDETTLGINLETLADVLGMAESGDDLIARLNAETKKLELSFPNTGLEYTCALIDPDAIRQEPDIPDLDLGGEFVVPGRAIDRGLSAADLVSDHIRFEGVADDTLRLSADGDTDTVDLVIDDTLIDGELTSDDQTESLFSLEYLNDITRPIGSDTAVTVDLGSEMPVKLHFGMGDDINVSAMVAPRIQGD